MDLYRVVRTAIRVASICLGAALLCFPTLAQSEQDTIKKLQEKTEQLEKRLGEQEAKNAWLENQIKVLLEKQAGQVQAGTQSASTAPPAAEKPVPPGQASAPQSAPAAAPAKVPVTAKSSVELYGYLKLDSAGDRGQTFPGNYVLWTVPSLDGEQHEQYYMTANATRLGLNFKYPGPGTTVTSGKAEIDFFGGGAENKANPMMRHAYLQVEWPESGFGLLAGQTNDLVSPLPMPTVNYSVGWYGGNIGYRHPQIRLTKDFKVGDKSSVTLQGAFVRTMGHLVNERNTGVDSSFPTVQSRFGWTFPVLADKKGTVGISGHWGREAYRSKVAGEPTRDYTSWSANLDMKIPLSKRVTLMGEAFTGRDLDSYLGGSDEAINVKKGVATRSSGGWLALNLGGFEKMTFNLGAGLDNPWGSDLSPGARCRNRTVFGNGLFDISKAAQIQAEISYWDTRYIDKPGGRAFRMQLSFQYNF